MNKLIPSFITSKKPKSSLPLPPPHTTQSIKAKRDPPSNEEIEVQVDIPKLLSESPSSPSLSSYDILKSELELAFRKFDVDGNGLISPDEVRSLLQCMGDEATEEEAACMVREADANMDGFLDLQEFINLLMRPPKPPSPQSLAHIGVSEDEEELRRAFRLFDKDKNGFISAEELHEMLRSLGEEDMSLQDCRQMIHNVDYNKDGVVDFEEFKVMMAITTCA